jgi:hypothetical protein
MCGTLLITGGSDGVRLRDVDTGIERRYVGRELGAITQLQLLAEDRVLAVGDVLAVIDAGSACGSCEARRRWRRERAIVLRVPVLPMFESLDAFRAYCGDPTLPLEDCPICSKLPDTCSREAVDCELRDDRPPEMLRLEPLVTGDPPLADFDRKGAISRCPTCHRLYFEDVEYVAPTFYFDSYRTWTRYDVDTLFNVAWCGNRSWTTRSSGSPRERGPRSAPTISSWCSTTTRRSRR